MTTLKTLLTTLKIVQKLFKKFHKSFRSNSALPQRCNINFVRKILFTLPLFSLPVGVVGSLTNREELQNSPPHRVPLLRQAKYCSSKVARNLLVDTVMVTKLRTVRTYYLSTACTQSKNALEHTDYATCICTMPSGVQALSATHTPLARYCTCTIYVAHAHAVYAHKCYPTHPDSLQHTYTNR